jgi:putative holliday junction resolvase
MVLRPREAPTLDRDAPVRQGVRLAVDFGSVRVGVARSDRDGVLASPLAVLCSGRGTADELAKLAEDADAIEVIVGLPTSLSGREGNAASGARSFAAGLARRLAPIPVRLVDERLTTAEAHAALRRGGRDSRARRPVVDAAAAAVLLQAALDAERTTGHPPGEPAVPPRGDDPAESSHGGVHPPAPPRPPRGAGP